MVSKKILDSLWYDLDTREELLRKVVTDRLAARPAPVSDEHIIATYFFAFRSQTLQQAVEEISYHATSGVRHPAPGSLLEACSAKPAGVDAFDDTGRLGILHIAFPLKMMLQPDGHLTSSDILHTTAGAIIFDVYENQDARLLSLQIPPHVLKTFPGPFYGPAGVRQAAGFSPTQPAFGTILKPTAGITPKDVGRLVREVAGNKLFLFIKEDEDLYPNLDYSPVVERTKRAVDAIHEVSVERGGLGILFAPHISGAPHEIQETVLAVMEAGATAVMLSETWAGGTVRMVREATKNLDQPPAIYGHNAGIGVKTSRVWREVIDLLARLDGIDFRQTAPVRPGKPFLKPYGQEWEASEHTLIMPIEGINPTTIVRAGSLDQGNIGLNLTDAETRGISASVLFLAGSAINSIKNDAGVADPQLGAEAMQQAIDVHFSGELAGVPVESHLVELMTLAERKNYTALERALVQRYPLEALM